MRRSILIFDLRGRNAHFRDISTNSSALTYPFPPRTTISGLLGCMLGREDHAELFSLEKSNIAVGILNNHRTIMFPVKYLKITKGKIQPYRSLNPVQIIRGEGVSDVKYRVYISHEDETLLDKIEHMVKNHEMYYPICFGKAGLSCVAEMVARAYNYFENDKGNTLFSTVIPTKMIEKIDFIKDMNEGRKYMKVKTQRVMDADRNLKEIEEYIAPANTKGIYLEDVTAPYTAVNINGQQTNIAWL